MKFGDRLAALLFAAALTATLAAPAAAATSEVSPTGFIVSLR